MEEIGEKFKEKREEVGITVEEAASDLKIEPILIENLESGNHKVFKDILELKDTIKAYSKYLGFDEEEFTDDLNDYLFETTSKISIEDIKDRLKKEKEEEKKVKTPYTLETTKKSYTTYIIFILLIIILIIFYVILKQVFL